MWANQFERQLASGGQRQRARISRIESAVALSASGLRGYHDADAQTARAKREPERASDSALADTTISARD